MKANELRIGNWINVNGENVNIGYGVIMDMHKKQKGIKNNYLDTLTFNPIPLTPEILEKCGLWGKYKSVGYIYRNDILNLSSEDEGDNGLPIKDYVFHVYHDYKGQPIYYLHQLQNLYFALCGEELTFKP